MVIQPLSPTARAISWMCQIVAAIILGYAALLKFSGSPTSIYVFRELGIEGTMLVIAVIEAISAVLLLTRMPQYGAILGFCTMCGAILAHSFTLGMEVQNDGGLLVSMMATVIVATLVIMWIRRKRLPLVGHAFE